MDIPWLQIDDFSFPRLESALLDPNGLLAVGGDLNPERLIHAYRQGIFPWYEDSQPILWWSPNPRTVLFPDALKVSRSLRKRLRRGGYRVSCDTAFVEVMKACANVTRKGQNGTWITNPMIEAYKKLNVMNIAHSVEVWSDDNRLVGGLYGVVLGKVFFGESMFSKQADSSKIALVHLAEKLKKWEFALIDCQVGNPHLFSLGAQDISRETFAAILNTHTQLKGPELWPNHWY